MDEGMLKVIKELRHKQREFREKADRIEATIASLEEVFGGQMVLPEVQPVLVQPARTTIYRNKTIGDAAVMYLKSAGAPQKTRDIANALENGGAHSSDMYRAVYNALDGDELAHMVEGKRWALRAWDGN
jgi:hypothetical protein